MSSPAPALQAPPQTWETSGNGNNAEAGPSHTTAHDQTNGNTTTMTTDRAPDLPERPGDMGTNVNGYNPNNSMAAPSSYASRMNPMSSGYGGGYGGASYGGYGGGLSGGMYGGGYGAGGYGGGYGGSPYSRMGGAYGGGYGNGYSPYNNDPYNQPPTLSHQIQNSTAPAFAVMESLVGAFTSLAQLFESTYIATHSSFFAMVGVADQLGGLKTYLAQVLGVFSVLRLGKRIVAWIKGDRSAFSSSSTNPGNWAEEWNWKIGRAAGGPKDQGLSPPNGPTGSKRPSSKPLILFLLSSIGLPWLMSKLIKLLTRLQEEKQRAALGLAPGTMLDATGRPVNVNSNPNAAGGKAQGQPGTITFARALFPFEPTAGHELALKRDEIVAVMQRFEEGASSGGKELGWWRGRTRDGRTGWFPGNYVEILRRKETTTKTDPNVDPGRMSSAPASVA